MTNAELLAKIKAEIERQRKFIEGMFIEGDNNFYDGQDDAYNNILTFLSTIESEKPVPKELEEAAKEYAEGIIQREDALMCKQAFIAGAKWQKEQDDKDLSDKIAAAYQLGLADKEKQMMSEAVECMVTTNLANRPVIYLDQLKGFQYGDKVRVIIVKEDEK